MKHARSMTPQVLTPSEIQKVHKRVWIKEAHRRTPKEVANWRYCLVSSYRTAGMPSDRELFRIFLTEDQYRQYPRAMLALGFGFALGFLLLPVGYFSDRLVAAIFMVGIAVGVVRYYWCRFKADWEADWRKFEAARINYCRDDALGVVLECRHYGVRVPREAAVEAGMPTETKPRPMKPLKPFAA